MTTYSELFHLALRKIDDPSLAYWAEEDLSKELYSYLESAIRKLPQLRAETADRDEFDVTDIENTGFHNTLSNTAKEALVLGMHRAWLEPQMKSTTLTLQRYSKKEGYSQREFLSGLQTLDESLKLEIQKLLRDDTYIDNSYFD